MTSLTETGGRARGKLAADCQHVPRRVAILADDYPPGHRDPVHRHRRGQLIYAMDGVMAVTTDDFSLIVPPQRAVWVPPGIDHTLRCMGPVSLRTLYVDPAERSLPPMCRVIEVSKLLRELILEAARIPVLYDETGRDGRLVALLLDEIVRTPVTPLAVPMPRRACLARICRTLLDDPAQDAALDRWAAAAGMSRRNFTRAFREETGMAFSAWVRDVRLLKALSLLAMGQSVTRVAFDVGYGSASAFTEMFTRTLGRSPSRYVESFAGE
ncbi:MAG: AraC family transcriptional regulator [Sphingobium sp.]